MGIHVSPLGPSDWGGNSLKEETLYIEIARSSGEVPLREILIPEGICLLSLTWGSRVSKEGPHWTFWRRRYNGFQFSIPHTYRTKNRKKPKNANREGGTSFILDPSNR